MFHFTRQLNLFKPDIFVVFGLIDRAIMIVLTNDEYQYTYDKVYYHVIFIYKHQQIMGN